MMMLSRLQGLGRTQRLILNKVICNLEGPTANTQRHREVRKVILKTDQTELHSDALKPERLFLFK